jgi:hypothetical protein
MLQLAFRTPPAFHVEPFVAEPSPKKGGGWALYLGVAVLIAALLGARPAVTGMTSALGDWVANLDEPQPSLGASR